MISTTKTFAITLFSAFLLVGCATDSGSSSSNPKKNQLVERNVPAFAREHSINCNNGNATACNNLAWMYENGKRVKKDHARAEAYYHKSCKLGDLYSCADLGRMHYQGLEIPKELDAAQHFSMKACDGDIAKGCYYMGKIKEKGLRPPYNWKIAIPYYQKACDSGYRYACERLGQLHERLEKPVLAREAYRKACVRAMWQSCIRQAEMMIDGVGGITDYSRASRIYKRSCGALGEACFQAGQMLHKGLGVKKDMSRAIHYYKESCKRDHDEGCEIFKVLNAPTT